MKSTKNLKPALIAGSFLFLLLIVIGILGALGVFDRNPYGAEIKIENYNHYLKKSPKDTRYAVFTSLYNTVSLNTTNPPQTNAVIREGSFTSTTTQDPSEIPYEYTTFLIDIEELQQTYSAQVSWSNNPDANLGGYPILITCPSEDQLIYPAFDCKDSLSEDPVSVLYAKYPILNSLPLDISYYNDNYSVFTHYNINYKTNTDYTDLHLIITEYTAHSKELALAKIRELGYNPDDYKIEYVDATSGNGRPTDTIWQPTF